MADDKLNLNLDFESIVPWNGQNDTGKDVRLKLDRNWQRVVDAFNTLSAYLLASTDFDSRFLRKDKEDRTDYLIQFFQGLSAGMYVPGGQSGSKLHETGLTEAGKLLVNGLSRFVGQLQSADWDKGEAGWGITRDTDGKTVFESDKFIARLKAEIYDLYVQHHATFAGSLGSEEFVSGQKGWSIRQREYTNAAGETEYRSVAEFDDLMVRGIMQVTEFVVNQLLGENDNRIFTGMMEVEYYDAATDTLYLSTKGGTLYNPFRADDVIIVQKFGGLNSDGSDNLITKAYEFVVAEVGVGDTSLGQDRLDWIKFKNFTSPIEGAGLELISKGDTLVRYDNLSDDRRKGIIQINSVGDDTPYIDILHGAKTDPDNAVKGRIGNLGGIYHPLFGWLADFGAYLANFYGVGEFVIAHSGENVADAIKIAQGAFRTNFRQSQYDLGEEDNFLTNTNWTNGCEGWTMGADTTSYFLVGDELPQFFNFDLLSTEDSYAGIAELDGRDMLRLANSTARQANSLIRQPGTHKVYGTPTANGDGTYSTPYTDVADTLYLSVRAYVPNQESTLEFGFVDENGAFIDNAFHYTETLPVAVTGYSFKLSGTWDGVGDFCIRATGEVYVDLVSLTDKPLDNFKTTTETSIEQTAQSINLVGKRVTSNETTIAQLRVEVDNISLTVAEAVGTADDAKNLADAAQAAASAAASKATSASTAASNAASAAASAQTTANNAVTTANSANTTANNANTTANNAMDKAESAESTASDALEQTTVNATAIAQNKDSISLLAGAFTLQDGKYVLTEAAGVVLTDKMATLYATKTTVNGINNRLTTAESSISQLQVDVDGISATVTSVQGTAEDAKEVADAAQAAASAAASKATSASTAASNAASAAASAQTTANNAVTTANSANTTANKASTTANNAASAAADAQDAADAAQSTANTANSTANSALSKANTNATAISQNKNSISLLAGAFTLEDGKYVLTEAAGVVLTDKMATLYATKTTVDSLGNRVTAAEAKITTSVQFNTSTGKVTSNILLSADQIDLEGAVTFSMLASAVQSTINGKATSSDITSAVNTLKSSLGSLAYLSAVEKAQLGTTIISGGYIKAELLNVTEIYATKGTVGGFTIGSKSLTNTAADVSLSIGDLTGYKFVSLNDDNGVLYARNDGGTAVRIYTSSTSGIGLNITAQNSAKAISSTGNVNLTARPSGNELVTIAGLALACKTGTTFSAPANSSIGNSSAWVDFLIANGNITLPTASSCPGKVIFIKFKGSYRVYCSSPIYKGNEYSMYNISNGQYTDSFSARSLFFISDGYAWYEFLTYYRS